MVKQCFVAVSVMFTKVILNVAAESPIGRIPASGTGSGKFPSRQLGQSRRFPLREWRLTSSALRHRPASPRSIGAVLGGSIRDRADADRRGRPAASAPRASSGVGRARAHSRLGSPARFGDRPRSASGPQVACARDEPGASSSALAATTASRSSVPLRDLVHALRVGVAGCWWRRSTESRSARLAPDMH